MITIKVGAYKLIGSIEWTGYHTGFPGAANGDETEEDFANYFDARDAALTLVKLNCPSAEIVFEDANEAIEAYNEIESIGRR